MQILKHLKPWLLLSNLDATYLKSLGSIVLLRLNCYCEANFQWTMGVCLNSALEGAVILFKDGTPSKKSDGNAASIFPPLLRKFSQHSKLQQLAR